MKLLITLALAVAVLMPINAPANAQSSNCFIRSKVVDHLYKKFKESLIIAGLAANGSVMEVFSSPDGNTWTVILTDANGRSCIVASGEAWITIQPKKPGEKM